MAEKLRRKGDKMPIDYQYIFPPGICAYCGGPYEHDEHVKARIIGGVYTIPSCMDCNLSKGKKGKKTWLRWVRRNRPQKWRRIVYHHRGRRNWLSQLVHEVRDE